MCSPRRDLTGCMRSGRCSRTERCRGRGPATSMQRRLSATATVAGVNGDYFTLDEGLPTGMLMQSGVLETPPHPLRSSLGITDDGTLTVDRGARLGQWQ